MNSTNALQLRAIIAFLALSIISGCTHVSVSNPELLQEIESDSKIVKRSSALYPLSLDAYKECSNTRVSMNAYQATCSNKKGVDIIVGEFQNRGLRAIPVNQQQKESRPTISLDNRRLHGFWELVTGAFNIATLGFVPLYYYDDYIVTYKDPNKKINVTKKVRVSAYRSIFGYYIKNPQNLGQDEIKKRVQANLVREVLEEAKVGQ